MIARLLDRLSGRREAELKADAERLRVALASLLSAVDVLADDLEGGGRPDAETLRRLAWAAGRGRRALERSVSP